MLIQLDSIYLKFEGQGHQSQNENVAIMVVATSSSSERCERVVCGTCVADRPAVVQWS